MASEPGTILATPADGTDGDNDGVPDFRDNCSAPNPSQADEDFDGIGDPCESATLDADGDDVADASGNCPEDYDPLQGDADSNGVGDECEGTEPD